MHSIYVTAPKRATAYDQKSLAEFVSTVRAKPGPRGTIINIIREILEATDQPISWADVARALAHRNSSDLIMAARAVWSEFRKSTAVVPPASSTRRTRL